MATADVTHRPGAMTMDAGGAYGFVLLVGAELSSWWLFSRLWWIKMKWLFQTISLCHLYIYIYEIYIYMYWCMQYTVSSRFTITTCLRKLIVSGPLRPTALSRAALLETVGWARAAEQLLVLLSVVPLRWETVEIASCVVEIWLLLWGIFGSSWFLVWNYFWM